MTENRVGFLNRKNLGVLILFVVTGLLALVLLRIGWPQPNPEDPLSVPETITDPELADLYRRRAHLPGTELVRVPEAGPVVEESWSSAPGELAQAAAELTKGQLVSCNVGSADVPDGKGLITSPDPRVNPDEGSHMVVPYVINTQVSGGLLLFNALPGTRSAEWVSQPENVRTRITWTPAENGSPVNCETVQELSQRVGVFGTVYLEESLETGHVMLTGCGGFQDLGLEGGEFFMEVDSAESCHLQASIVGLGPVPTTGPAVLVKPQIGHDLTGIELTVPVPVSDWPGLALTVLEWSDGAMVWWTPDPDPALSEKALRIQQSLNSQADQVFDSVALAAAMLVEREDVQEALEPDELARLQEIADEVEL